MTDCRLRESDQLQTGSHVIYIYIYIYIYSTLIVAAGITVVTGVHVNR